MKNLYASNPILTVIIIVLVALLVASIVLVAVLISKRNKLVRHMSDKNVIGSAGKARNEQMTRDGEYYVLSRNVVYSVGQDADIIAGKYFVKSAVDSETSMNLRLNGLVQAYDSGIEVYLTNGDTISAVSESVVVKLV